MEKKLSLLFSMRRTLPILAPAILLLAAVQPIRADLTIGGTIYADLADPSASGVRGVLMTAYDGSVFFQTFTSGSQGAWQMSVPEGTYTIWPSKSGVTFQHVAGGVPDGQSSITTEVNQANEAANQDIQFVACGVGAVDADQSSIDATSPVLADGTNTSTITITAKDLCGNPINNIPAYKIRISATGTGHTITQPTEGTNANGQTTAEISSMVVETKTISVTIDGKSITDTAMVVFTSPPTPTVGFVSAYAGVPEIEWPVKLPVQLSSIYPQPVTVDYSVTGGTATGGGVDYTLSPGTLTFSPGDTTASISLAVQDDSLNEPDETVVIALSNPTNATLGPIATELVTIVDNDEPPSVRFDLASSSGSEAISPAQLAVELADESAETATVDYAVTGGTASGGGIDYALASGRLTFSPGDKTEYISLIVFDDSVDEPDETVIVTLTNPSNVTLGTRVSHTYTIKDNDPPPRVRFGTSSSSADEGSVSRIGLLVELSEISTQTVTVEYSAGGTATGGGVDYSIDGASLTFSPGERTKSIIITIVDDSHGEADETIVVRLNNATNATLGTILTHTHTIVNDDMPSIEFVSLTSSGEESISPATLAVQRLPATPDETATVDYLVTGGSANGGGVDYTLAAGTLTFSRYDTSRDIEIEIVDDSVQELDETIVVTLSNPSRATLGINTNHVYTIINDDDETPPQTSAYVPEPNSIQVPRDTVIQLHITDTMVASTSGVDANTVRIRLEGDLIYDGANERPQGVYDSTRRSQTVKGLCSRSGTPSDYTFVFQSSTSFDYEQGVDVSINAADKAGNAMAEQTYRFYTVMRSFGRNIKVNSDTGLLVQDNPATATDSAGNVWVVWDQKAAAGNTDIYIGKLEVDAGAFGTSVPVISDAGNQRNPAIAIDSSDKIYVVWQGADPNSMWDIFVATSTDGANWSTPVQVNSQDPNNVSNQTSPAIAIDRATRNKAYIVWQDDSAANKDICVGTSTDTTTWANAQITTDSFDQSEPAIAIDASNVAYVIWTDKRSLPDSDVYGASSAAGPWNNWPVVITDSNQSNPACSVAGGLLHLLWVDDANGDADIFYGNDASGLPVVGASVVDDTSGASQGAPSVISVVDATLGTKAHACWQDARYWTSNRDPADIFYGEPGPDKHNVQVNDDTGAHTQKSPDIGVDGDGNPYMVWVDNRSGNNDIYYARATTTGEPLPTSPPVVTQDKIIVELDGTTVGVVDGVDDLLVEIPKDALPAGITVKIHKIETPDIDLPVLPAGSFGVLYNLGPDGLQFLNGQPVTITIPHSASDCPGLPHYRVYWFDPDGIFEWLLTGRPEAVWREDGISNVRHVTPSEDPTLPADVHAVKFDTTHFTVFSVGAGAAGSGGGGGGGCSMSPYNQGNVVDFLLPYIAFVLALLAISWINARKQRTKC